MKKESTNLNHFNVFYSYNIYIPLNTEMHLSLQYLHVYKKKGNINYLSQGQGNQDHMQQDFVLFWFPSVMTRMMYISSNL